MTQRQHTKHTKHRHTENKQHTEDKHNAQHTDTQRTTHNTDTAEGACVRAFVRSFVRSSWCRRRCSVFVCMMQSAVVQPASRSVCWRSHDFTHPPTHSLPHSHSLSLTFTLCGPKSQTSNVSLLELKLNEAAAETTEDRRNAASSLKQSSMTPADLSAVPSFYDGHKQAADVVGGLLGVSEDGTEVFDRVKIHNCFRCKYLQRHPSRCELTSPDVFTY